MYYSPIFFSEIADLNLTQFSDCNVDMDYLNSLERVLIYSTHLLWYLIKLEPFLTEIKKPFIIVSAMEDAQFPLEFNNDFVQQQIRLHPQFKDWFSSKKNILNDFVKQVTSNPYFKHWFSINKTIPNDSQFTSIPYGLDFWTIASKDFFGEKKHDYITQNNRLHDISIKCAHFSERIPLIYGNFHHHFTDERNGNWRKKLLTIIPKEIIYYDELVPRSQSFCNMGKYAFVLSPPGNGFDCIRTFEALCMGCIVIMQKNFLEVIYTDLPILLVDEYSDINEQLLKDTLTSFSKKSFNYEKLTFEYWKNLVYSKF